MSTCVHILVGDAFTSNKIFFNKDTALSELKLSYPYRYVLTYIPNRRNNNDEAKLVSKYIIKKSWEGGYTIQEDKLWNTDDTDYGFLYNINPDLPKIFEYDEYDNITKYKEELGDLEKILLNSEKLNFPGWLKKIINDLNLE